MCVCIRDQVRISIYVSMQHVSGVGTKGVHAFRVASFPGPIPSISILHAEKIGEPGDEAMFWVLKN